MTGPEDGWTEALRDGYDRVADAYAATIFDELQHKPFDRALLDRFFEAVRPIGPACDLGCGPGQVARYLHDRGLPIFGLDLSAQMVAQARGLSPELTFEQGSMLAIPCDTESLGGITAFYSVIHIPRPRLADAFREMHRVLRPAGLVLIAFHLGPQDRHLEEFLGQSVSMDFYFFTPAEVEHWLEETGFSIVESLERDPYPDVEHQSRRAYILARKPSSATVNAQLP